MTPARRLTGLILFTLLAWSSAAVPPQRGQPFVPIGVWYAGGDAQQRDLETIRTLGFNSIRIAADWARGEPVRGEYRFAALDQLLGRAGQADLKVIVRIDTASAPDWIQRSYPDAGLVVDRQGAVPPASAYCLDHPAVRADVDAFIRAASARVARYASVYAIDVALNPYAGFCTCPHSRRRLTEWITAGGAKPAPVSVIPIDKATFTALNRRDELKMKVDAASPRGARLVTSHTDAPSVLLGQPSAPQDDWLMSGVVDHYGTAISPRTAPAGRWSPVQLALAFDGIRSAARDRGWWSSALQAGDATAGDLRLWTWTALSRGARAISYDAGFIAHDGAPTDHARAAGFIAGIVSRNPALFAPLRTRPSEVAIVYNPLPVLVEDGTGPEAAALRGSMAGFYRAMLERNIHTDFIHLDEIVTGFAGRYRAVFLPYPVVLTQPVADALKAYVGAGGTLISEGRPAASNERGQPATRIPGSGLDDVFGARETALRSSTRIAMTAERSLDGDLAALAGRIIAGGLFAEHLEPTRTTTRVLARFAGESGAPGDPAIVMSAYGGGRAILIGSLPAVAFDTDPVQHTTSGELLAALAALAGVKPDVGIDGARGLVETRFLESSDVIMFIGLNHTDTLQKVTFRFPPDTQEAIWQNMVTGTAVNFVATREGPRYTYTFGPKDALVLMIRKHMR